MSKELWDKGLAARKDVLGAEYVERQLKTVDDFGMPMQELVTQSCWGWLWTRPQLPRKMRSLASSTSACSPRSTARTSSRPT